MLHPINFNFGKNSWVRSYRTRRRKRWPNTLVSPASKGWAYDQPTSKPISLHFPKHVTLSYFGIEKSVHNTWSTTFQKKKRKTSLHRCPCPMTQLAQCQNFQKPISTTFPALSLKIHNLCKIIRNHFKNPNFFQRFFFGVRIPLWSFFLTSHHLGGDSPCPPRHQASLHITTTKLRDSCRELTSKTCGRWPVVVEAYPQMVGNKKQQNKYMTWDSPPEWHYIFEYIENLYKETFILSLQSWVRNRSNKSKVYFFRFFGWWLMFFSF